MMSKMPMSGSLEGWRFPRRLIVILVALLSTAGLVLLVATSETSFTLKKPYIPSWKEVGPWATKQDGEKANPLDELAAKYAHLLDDKFTIALHTHERPKELNETLFALTQNKIPSLLEIVVVWSNFDQPLPEAYDTEHGVHVRYRMSQEDSLNEKLRPDPEFQTQAILLTDDDVYYEPEDLEFVFQSWRKFGQFRLVGALPRCSVLDKKKGTWKYTFCIDEKVEYSMILTNLCFSHIAFLGYYWSDVPEVTEIRKYVDDHFNCEDIALNFLASNLTGYGPLEANGDKKYHNMEPAVGISRKPGHVERRSQCLNDFADILGGMTLVNETMHIVRGMKVL